MGYSFSEPAWSWSRQRLFHRCPRAFYYNYYPWGDGNQDVVSFLKRAKSVPLVVGDIAHDFIAIALKQFKSHRKWVDVAPSALRRYDDVIRESARLAESARAGRRPASEGTVLLHHLNLGPSEVLENAGKENLAEVLANFGSKEIRSNLGDPAKWYPIMGGFERKPYVSASSELGFKRTGFNVYTAYDFATKPAFDCIIVDWKTGAAKERSRVEAKAQLTSYALWGMEQGLALENIRLVSFYLTPDETWSPFEVSREDVRAAISNIENHVQLESSLVRPTQIEDRKSPGKKKTVWRANIDDFQPKPSKSNCRGCNFRTICEAGQRVFSEDQLTI